jgi:hypothetical protein
MANALSLVRTRVLSGSGRCLRKSCVQAPPRAVDPRRRTGHSSDGQAPDRRHATYLVDQMCASWNQVVPWLRRMTGCDSPL